MKYFNLSFLLLSIVVSQFMSPLLADESGLPQFDTSKYSQQIFWLIINFGLLYLFVKYFVIKRIKKTKLNRSGVILANIEKSIKIKKNIDKTNDQINSIKQIHKIELAKSKELLLKKISDISKSKNEDLEKYKSDKLKDFEQQKKEYAQNIDFDKSIKQLSEAIIEKLKLTK